MAEKYVSQGTAGVIQYDTDELLLLAAPGAGKRYKITKFSVDYTHNNCEAYFQNTSGTNKYEIISGSVTTKIGDFGYNNPSGGYYPDVSWTGTMLCPVNTALNYKVTRNSTATSGIKNQYYVYLTYEILTQPATVSPGDLVTKAQMDSLRAWKNKGTAVTRYATITAEIGNTYKNNVTAGSSKLDDAWYNSII